MTAAAFGTCLCGHPVYDHGRRKIPSGGGKDEITGCRIADCLCSSWRAGDGSGWPENGAAAGIAYASEPLDEPDTSVESEHWVGGRVLLTGDEPPL